MDKNDLNNGKLSGHSPFLIGVGGGTASGKSTVCRKIMEKLGQDIVDNNKRRVVCISQESFYKVLNESDRIAAAKGIYDFDHPNALDNELMSQMLKDILKNKIVRLPVYDFVTHSRKLNETITVYPADVVLFEGILAFYFPDIRNLFDMKLFVDTDPDTRLSKRVIRDVKDRGRDLELVINQYIKYVKPAFEEFCQPTKKHADVIIPRGADNEVAIDLIVQAISDYLKNKENPNWKNGEHFGIQQVKSLVSDSLVNAQEDGLNSRSMTPVSVTNH